MVCSILADGLCEQASNGPAIPPKYLSYDMDRLENLVIATDTNIFTLTWDTTNSYPGQYVRVVHRESDNVGYNEATYLVDRDGGSFVSQAVLYSFQKQSVWVRIEDAEMYAQWTRMTFISAESTLSESSGWPGEDDLWLGKDSIWPSEDE
jgi:hypothetical protein